MDKGKYKVGRLNAGLREIAEAAGYTPGEFSMLRFAEDVAIVREWRTCLRAGRVPPDLQPMSINDARAYVAREERDISDRERAWAEFFYPKLKSQDSTLSVSGELSLLDLLKRDGGDTSSGA